jgi:hypothetical protein
LKARSGVWCGGFTAKGDAEFLLGMLRQMVWKMKKRIHSLGEGLPVGNSGGLNFQRRAAASA